MLLIVFVVSNPSQTSLSFPLAQAMPLSTSQTRTHTTTNTINNNNLNPINAIDSNGARRITNLSNHNITTHVQISPPPPSMSPLYNDQSMKTSPSNSANIQALPALPLKTHSTTNTNNSNQNQKELSLQHDLNPSGSSLSVSIKHPNLNLSSNNNTSSNNSIPNSTNTSENGSNINVNNVSSNNSIHIHNKQLKLVNNDTLDSTQSSSNNNNNSNNSDSNDLHDENKLQLQANTTTTSSKHSNDEKANRGHFAQNSGHSIEYDEMVSDGRPPLPIGLQLVSRPSHAHSASHNSLSFSNEKQGQNVCIFLYG